MTPRAGGLRWGVGMAVSLASHAGFWMILVRRPDARPSASRYERVRIVDARVDEGPRAWLARGRAHTGEPEGASERREAHEPEVRGHLREARGEAPEKPRPQRERLQQGRAEREGNMPGAGLSSLARGRMGPAEGVHGGEATDAGAIEQEPTGSTDHGASAPEGDPIVLPRGGLAELCGGVAVDRRLLGQGFFPRRYLWILVRSGENAFRGTGLLPVGESLPYVDTTVARGLSRGCRPATAALSRLAPARFANGTPTTITLRVEITDEATVPRPPGTP